MPSLADRLKALGVKVGTADLPARAPKAKKNVPIEDVLDGRWIETRQGEAFVAESIYPLEYRHGLAALFSAAPLHNLAHWAGDMRIHDMPIEKFAFLDTETSGLSGGTGTYAFLVGIGRFIEDKFVLQQFFMRDPAEEPAMLEG